VGFITDSDWIKENWEQVKCLSFQATNALFSASVALQSDGLSDPTFWGSAYRGLESVGALLGCVPPPRSLFEETFEGPNKRCQCAQEGGQLHVEYTLADGTKVNDSQSGVEEAKEIKTVNTVDVGITSCTWIATDSVEYTTVFEPEEGNIFLWYIVPKQGTACCADVPYIPPVLPIPPPFEYPNPEPDARPKDLIIHLDSCVDRFGLLQNFYEVRHYTGTTSYASVYYWETIRGPYIYNQQDSCAALDSFPKYGPPHPHAAPFGGGNNSGVSDLLAVTYTLDAGCTYNEETEDYDTKYTYDVENTPNGILGLARRMDALAWMINNAQLIPYTTCANTRPELEGQWVTTRWESDAKMDHSGRRLRKLFRYRTKSTRNLGQLSAYWEDFTWHAGDVIVWHEGAWWGSPKVWAQSTEEGQRVIRHAASEAGIDPDQVGRWKSGSSHSPRYGMSGNMRILKKDGFPWVASRDGADWPNYLAKSGDS